MEVKVKVLLINGSPKVSGNTARALEEMTGIFHKEGVETEILHVGNKVIRGCVACGSCGSTGKCIFNDLVNEAAPKLEAADGLVLASPVYYASANATLIAFLDRLFYSTHFSKAMKVGAAVVVARRGGTTASFDELNKYFTISEMPVASGRYWNNVFGAAPGQAEADEEGLQNMRILARNMTFLMRGIALAREKYGMPEQEKITFTNFVR